MGEAFEKAIVQAETGLGFLILEDKATDKYDIQARSEGPGDTPCISKLLITASTSSPPRALSSKTRSIHRCASFGIM